MNTLLPAILMLVLPAYGATRYVNVHSATPLSPYKTPATAARQIGQAVAAADPGDTILVATGRYVLAAPVVLSKAVAVRASGPAAETIVDGNEAVRGFTLTHAGARLDGFTVTRGRAESGAGVYNQAGAVLNCIITGNTAAGPDPRGGGLYNLGRVKNCQIVFNTAVCTETDPYSNFARGGGLYTEGLVEDCGISGNTGIAHYAWGGGAAVVGGRLVRGAIQNNAAQGVWYAYGGGVYAQYGAEVRRCWVSGNTANATESGLYTTAAADGGGLYLANGSEALDSLLAGNTARSAWGFASGGGAWVSGSALTRATVHGNSAIGGNHAPSAGGVTWGYTCACQGSIIWANAGSGNHAFIAGAAEVDFDYTCTDFIPPGTGNLNQDPLLVNPAAMNHRLQAASPCVDRGMPGVLPVELDGYPRWQDGNRDGANRSDIGCYEYGDFIRGAVCDFDGDGRTDPAVMRAANGRYRLLFSQRWRNRDLAGGSAGWIPVCADFDGDTLADPAWWSPVDFTWRIQESQNGYALRKPLLKMGAVGDTPLAADFDGDGRADPAIRRASDGNYRIWRSSTASFIRTEGAKPAWIPCPGDYDGDGVDDPAWYVPGTPGRWRIHQSRLDFALLLPLPTSPNATGARPIRGDFDADGRIDRALYVPSTGKFMVKESGTGRAWISRLGNKAWKPAPGDYDGDGLTDCGWFIPASGQFQVLYSDVNNASQGDNRSEKLPAFNAQPTDIPVAWQKVP